MTPASAKNKPIRSVEVQQKIANLKVWSINTYKCSKQMMNEKLGRTTKTVDPDLEKKIEVLLDTQTKYNRILSLARSLNTHLYNLIQTQRSLAELFTELSFKQPGLQDPFTSNANTQKSLIKNGDQLLSALRFFIDSLDTLVNKTIQDTVLTVRQYQSARVQYDAYRNESEQQSTQTAASGGTNGTLSVAPGSGDTTLSAATSDNSLEQHKSKFELLHRDVDIKLKLLDENKLKVMTRQLALFETALSAFMSGNAGELDTVLKEFKIKVTEAEAPSFLERR